MKTIAELLQAKTAGPIHSVGPDETVFAAVTQMAQNNIGAVLVLEGDAIRGILTERDYLRFIAVQGRTARDTPVRELMTAKVIYVTPDSLIEEAMGLMTECRIRHLPVIVDGRLGGIVSIGDLVKQISHDQKVQIRTLEQFIADPYPGPTGA